MTSGSMYTVSVSNVQDLALNTIVPGSEPSGSTTDMNILLAWDLSAVPPGATVETASMTLEVTNTSTGSYACHEVLSPWDESSVTWNDAAANTAWSSPGASGPDCGNDTVCVVSASATGPPDIAFNAAGSAMLQAWVSDPASNHGLVIADPNTADGADFHSRESATAVARPALSVTYRVPTTPPPNQGPIAAFSYACVDLDCDFTDTSSDPDGSVVAWYWDFGDGDSSTAQNPGHSYASAAPERSR